MIAVLVILSVKRSYHNASLNVEKTNIHYVHYCNINKNVALDLYGEGTQQKKVKDRFFIGDAKRTSGGTLKSSFP